MDKKVRTHHRVSSSSSSSSSSATSFTSSSSSSSSYDSRRLGGRGRSSAGYKDQSHSKKSRSTKYSGSGDRQKQKKNKRSSSAMWKHGSKGTTKKFSHSHSSRKDSRDFGSKDYSSKDYDRINKSRSPVHHHRRSGTSKKSVSLLGKRSFSPLSSRKSRKRSPSVHKKTHKRSISPRSDYHHTLSPSRPRDPRIERALKRSPDYLGRDSRYRDSPKRYEKEELYERPERSVISSGSRLKDDRHKDISRFDRDLYEERRRDDRDTGREKKLLKDRISFKDRFYASEHDGDRDEGRFSRDGFAVNRKYEGERDFYPRVESRESSLERKSYDDPYERFDRERKRIETRNRYEELSHDRLSAAGDYSIDPRDDRRRQVPLDCRYVDDRRKVGHDMWPDDHRNAGPSSSMIDRLQDPMESRAYAHHRRSGDWPIEGRRIHDSVGWDKHSPQKRRGPEWGPDDYPGNEWRDRPREWESAMDDHGTDWHPRRYQNWNEGDRGDWGGNMRKRGGKSPNLPTPAPVARTTVTLKKEPSIPTTDAIPDVPRDEDASFVKPEIKSFNPMSPSKQQLEEGKISPVKEEKDEIVTPDEPLIEKDNFSDFSDDSDDILNKEVLDVPEEKIEPTTVEDSKILPGEATTYDDMLDEERMNLEEISDDDFEEDKQMKYSVANALDIDWSTLKYDPNPQVVVARTSALKRFSALNVLSRLGVSSKYASKEFLDELADKCYKMELDRINNKNDSTDKSEYQLPSERSTIKIEQPEATITIEQTEATIKQEPEDENSEKEEPIETEESVATPNVESVPEDLPQILPVVVEGGVLKHLRQSQLNRSRMFYFGRKALCSKDDIILRRRLCNLPDDDILFEKPQFNQDLFTTTWNLLKA